MSTGLGPAASCGRGAAQFSETPAGDPRLVASVDLENCTMPSTPKWECFRVSPLDIGEGRKGKKPAHTQLVRMSCSPSRY